MYVDAGYGDNWQPEGNNARRFDPYTRSCAALIGLFAIGFVLCIIVVLSLIPIYISHKSASTNIQTSKIALTKYVLYLTSPFDTFDSQTILSSTENRLRLQAALTSILQRDSVTVGSIIEIDQPTGKLITQRRQISDGLNLIFDINITNNKTCATTTCLNQYQSRVNRLLSNSTKTTSFIRYQESNSTSIYWLTYQLPKTIKSDVSYAYVDPKTIAMMLEKLLTVDQTENQPFAENSTSTITG